MAVYCRAADSGGIMYCMLMHAEQQEPVQPKHRSSSQWRDGNCRLPAGITSSLTQPAPSAHPRPGPSRLIVVFAKLL